MNTYALCGATRVALVTWLLSLLFLQQMTYGATRMTPDYLVDEEVSDFVLEDAYGNEHRLKHYRNKHVVLCFFDYEGFHESWRKREREDIVGQLKMLRDAYPFLQQCNIEILGISPSSATVLKDVVERHKIPYPLLCDIGRAVSSPYGATNWGSIVRSTLILNERGIGAAAVVDTECMPHLAMIYFYALQQATRQLKMLQQIQHEGASKDGHEKASGEYADICQNN